MMGEMSFCQSSTVIANYSSKKWLLAWKSKFKTTDFLRNSFTCRIIRIYNTSLKMSEREKLGHKLLPRRGETSHLPFNAPQKLEGLEECPVFTGDKEREPAVGEEAPAWKNVQR